MTMLFKIAFHPSMIATFVAILLVTASSMIVNDFYDAKNGVDQHKLSSSIHSSLTSSKSLASGKLPLSIARNALKLLYGCVLLLSTIIPSMLSRFLVIIGTITTFCYTSYLKPRTWWKNVSCAFLMAVTPLTSASTCMQLLSPLSFHGPNKDLVLLISSLFFGFLGREMLMDVTDVDADRQSGIVTVPVKYGKSFTVNVILGTWVASTVLACVGPCHTLVRTAFNIIGGENGGNMISRDIRIQLMPLRQLILSLSAGTILIRRGMKIRKANGLDEIMIHSSIESCKAVVLLYLAAFV